MKKTNCLVQEAEGTGSSSKYFLFQQLKSEGPSHLLTTKLYLNALQLRQKAIQTTMSECLSGSVSPRLRDCQGLIRLLTASSATSIKHVQWRGFDHCD